MPADIILMVCGIVIMVISVVFTGNRKDTDNDLFYTEENLKKIKKEFEEDLQKKADEIKENMIVSADDTLSNISNEKIMAMDDFYKQNLEKIDENHEHVVFLYNMLNSKDEEIKDTLKEMQNAKADLKESVEDVIKITKQLKKAVKKNSDNFVNANDSVSNNFSVSKDLREESLKANTDTNNKASKDKDANLASGISNNSSNEFVQTSLPGLKFDNKNEEILRLYKSGRSILDISKSLKMGQGEVKLVVDLYGA